MMKSRMPPKEVSCCLACTSRTRGERSQPMSQIMIVEDSRALRKVMEVLLHREEIDAESYTDGYTALRAMQAPNHPVPAVVLLDLGLPVVNQMLIDGYTFARLLRAQPRFDSTAIIVLSGHDDVL